MASHVVGVWRLLRVAGLFPKGIRMTIGIRTEANT